MFLTARYYSFPQPFAHTTHTHTHHVHTTHTPTKAHTVETQRQIADSQLFPSLWWAGWCYFMRVEIRGSVAGGGPYLQVLWAGGGAVEEQREEVASGLTLWEDWNMNDCRHWDVCSLRSVSYFITAAANSSHPSACDSHVLKLLLRIKQTAFLCCN